MKNDSIKFSVIIPVYNAEKYISECIESLLIQSYQNFEILLVDDGSIDNSGKICDSYRNQYDNIIVIHKENEGQLSARLKGIERAIGDFCVFVDADDTLKQNALEIIKDEINISNCDCVVYGFDWVSNGKICRTTVDKGYEVITDKRILYRKMLFYDEYYSIWRKAIRKNAFPNKEYSDYHNVRLGEDLIQSCYIMKNCFKVVFIDKVLYNYRYNSDSVTHNINADTFSTIFTPSEYVYDFLKEENVFDKEDFNDWRFSRIHSLIPMIQTIANLDVPYKIKRSLFEEIKSQKFFKNFLLSSNYNKQKIGKKYFIFWLFLKSGYRLIVLCEYILEVKRTKIYIDKKI